MTHLGKGNFILSLIIGDRVGVRVRFEIKDRPFLNPYGKRFSSHVVHVACMLDYGLSI